MYLESNKGGATATIYGNTVPANTEKYPTLAEGIYPAQSASRATYTRKGIEDLAIIIGNGGELPTVNGNPTKNADTMGGIFFHMGNDSRASLSTTDGRAISAGCQTSGSYPGSRRVHNDFMAEVGLDFKGAYYLRSQPSFSPPQPVPFSSDLSTEQ